MNKEILINSSNFQTRVAITEDNNVVDFLVEYPEKRKVVGDIYLGKIARVLPGIRAAFIDIGWKHDAFLHFSDIGDRLNEIKEILDDEDVDVDDEERSINDVTKDDDDDEFDEDEEDDNEVEQERNRIPKLYKGQEILVQIIKEPVKDKGVRVTSAISLPGRFCVLLPGDYKTGISKKIQDFRERRRLKKIAKSIIPNNCGIIIRTAAKDQPEELLQGDLIYLVKTWEQIQVKVKKSSPPSLIFTDLTTTRSVIRDLVTDNVNRLIIDSKSLYKEIKDYVLDIQPELVEIIEYYKDNVSIFEKFKIEEQIRTMMGRKVPLPSGGHIVIEHTEAMTVIDVNSGRYAAKKDQELNSLKTDLEASREIVRQLRLRDIGGLIVVDFIDLEDEKNRKKVYDELKKEFKKDRAKQAILPMTNFGLIQITRQRVRENIVQSINEVCPYCNGTGLLIKKSNLIHEIEDWLKKYKNADENKHPINIRVHTSLAESLTKGFISTFLKFRLKYYFNLKLIIDDKMNPQEYIFSSAKTGEDITKRFQL